MPIKGAEGGARQINIIVQSREWGEINKGVDGLAGTPANSVDEALYAVARGRYPVGRTFIEETGKPATVSGVKSGR